MSADRPPPDAVGDGGVEAGRGLPRRGHWLVRLFAAIGLIGILCVIGLMAMIVAFDRPQSPAKVAAGKEAAEFTVGTPEDLPGTNLMHLSVSASGGGGSGPYSGRQDDQRNVLLIDKQTGASRKILPNNARRIVGTRFLPEATQIADRGPAEDASAADGPPRKAPPAAYYFITLAQRDRPELSDVLVGTLTTGRQGIVMEGIDGVDTVWMQSPTRIGLIARERLGLYYRIIDIPSLKVVQSRRIVID